MRILNAADTRGICAACIASGPWPHHIIPMSDDRHRDHRADGPRREPEIIPPGQDGRDRRAGLFMRFEERDGVHRVYIARPSLPSILLGLLLLGLIAAIAFLVLAGLIILWVPILIGAILLALLSAALRRRGWWR